MAQGLLSSLANVAVGRATPIDSGLTAEQEARRRTELAQALVNIAEAESSITVSQQQLAMEGVESWSNVQTSLANAHANLIESVASFARAQSMDRASTAELLGVLTSGPEMVEATKTIYGKLTPEETKRDFRDDLQTITASSMAEINQANLPVSQGQSGGDGAAVLSNEYNQRIVDLITYMSEKATDQMSELPPAARVEHRNRSVTEINNAVGVLLNQLEEKAVEDGLEPGTINSMETRAKYSRALANTPLGTAVTDEETAEYENRFRNATATVRLQAERVNDYLGGGVTGISGQLKRANDALDRIDENLGQDPYKFLEDLPAVKMPSGIGEAKELLRAELARLDAPDPLVAAVAEMQAMTPGFDVMREAMGFRSNEALAMFFKRNPDYYLDVMRKVRQQQDTKDFQDMIDLGSTDAMEDFLGTIKHSPPRVPYSPPSQGQVSTAAPQPQAALPDDVGDGIPEEVIKPEPLDVQEIQDEQRADPSLFDIYDDDDEQEDIPYGTGMVPTRDPNKRFPGRFPSKKTEAFAQIQSDLQRRLSRILTPPTGDDTPPIKTA